MSENDTTDKTIDISGIMELLPHRYPLLLVDRILEYTSGSLPSGSKTSR